MKKLFTYLFLNALTFTLFGQTPKVTEIGNSVLNSDSSYYDALVFAPNHIWFIGKHGIITQVKNDCTSSIKHPALGNNILSASQIDNENYILTGDKGNIYFYNLKQNAWRTLALEAFKKSCFYSVKVLNEREILICGGNSRIAKSEKAIPGGFIIKSEDGGKSWKKVYHSTYNMAWRINTNENQDKIFVNLYHPNKTILICSTDGGTTWKKSGIKAKGLVHDFYVSDNYNILVGGPGIKNRKVAYANINKVPVNFPELGFIYDIKKINNTMWLSCGKSSVAYKDEKSDEWKTIKLNNKESKNIYKTIYAGDNVYYALGSGKKIYKITFE